MMSSCGREGEGRYGDVGSEIFECDAHAAAEGQAGVRPVEQTTDEANVGLLVEGDVDQHNWKQGIESREEGLMEGHPGAYGAISAHWFEDEFRVRVVATGTDDVGGVR
jgi:hypothetical protein